MSGALVLVATPIGNLGDISQRARDALAAADLIACEDSRHSGRLVKHLGIADPHYVVVNEHTEREACTRVVDAIAAGKTVALISDAGTPAISDPGAVVVRAVIAAGLTVSAVPGPAALVMALVISGLPTTRFVFEGFLPRSGADRKRRLADIAAEERTVIFYESPHRIVRTLDDLVAACGGQRRVAVTRELTKLHEDVWRGTIQEASAHFATSEPQGEFAIVVEGAPPAPTADDALIARIVDEALADGLSVRDAADRATTTLGVPRRAAYRIALSRRSSGKTR
jgi:16S rRNA (cytidine1402-2'-O)-methyltransferase